MHPLSKTTGLDVTFFLTDAPEASENWTDTKASFLKMERMEVWKTIILWSIEVKRTTQHEKNSGWQGIQQFLTFPKKWPKERAKSFGLKYSLLIQCLKVHQMCSPWGSIANMLYISSHGKKLFLSKPISIIQIEKMSHGIRPIINLDWYPIVANNRCFRGKPLKPL